MKRSLKVFGLTFLIIGILLYVTGIFFKLHEWPDIFYGVYTGLVFIAIGILLLIIKFVKNSKSKS